MAEKKVDAAHKALVMNRQNSLQLVQGAGARKTKKLLQRAAMDLHERLEDLHVRGLDQTFTAVQMRATLKQVELVLNDLTGGLKGMLQQGTIDAGQAAVKDTLKYMRSADQLYAGSAAPLPLREARMMEKGIQGANASLLRRLASDPDHPARRGILKRYGLETISSFEETMQAGLIARKTWREMRDDLREDSPFLAGKPAHWANRIARTEISYSYNRASHEAIKQANDDIGGFVKILSGVFDERTGADSYASHGQIRRPEEDFVTWYGAMEHPPDRPYDRSSVVPHRIVWPIPTYLEWKEDDEIEERWEKEGHKAEMPDRPDPMTTVDLDQFGVEESEEPSAEEPSAEEPSAEEPSAEESVEEPQEDEEETELPE